MSEDIGLNVHTRFVTPTLHSNQTPQVYQFVEPFKPDKVTESAPSLNPDNKNSPSRLLYIIV